MDQSCWILENEIMRSTISYVNGSIRMSGLLNKITDMEYMNQEDPGYLFYYRFDGLDIYSNDGSWTLGETNENPIELYGITWGKELEFTLTRTLLQHIQIKLVFQIYADDSGLRLQTFVTNLEDNNTIISESDIMGLKLVKLPCDIHYVENSLTWVQTRDRLHDGKRNAVVLYDQGEGWVLSPENNYSTSLEPGAYKGTSKHPFLKIDIWEDEAAVRVSTDSGAVQVVLKPCEEIEYFAINLTVFQGDVWDGRLSAAKHLRRRYKFHDPSRILSVNDWFFREKRTESYYRNVLIPSMLEMGFDSLLIDDLWNTPTRDDTNVSEAFSKDLPGFAEWMRNQGIKMGYWFALTGDEWGAGRDLANPDNIAFKKKQVEEVLISQYLSSWQQIDLGELWKNDAATAYSHPSDSVYRKWLSVRSFMNDITYKYPDFLMQTTCELENPIVTDQSVGLMHLADNGIAGLFWGGVRAYQVESKDYDHYPPEQNMFGYFGLFPSEGMLDFWNTGTWKGTVAQFYTFLLGRHISIYDDPSEFDLLTRNKLKLFNNWRNNTRIKSLLNEIILPLPDNVNGDHRDLYPWMFMNRDQTQALVIVLDDQSESAHSFLKVRWLNDQKDYLVQDITLGDDGQFHYDFVGSFGGKDLHSIGICVDERINHTGVKVYWIQEKKEYSKQVLYADEKIHHYEEDFRDHTLYLKIIGESNKDAQLLIFDVTKDLVDVVDVHLDIEGHGIIQL